MTRLEQIEKEITRINQALADSRPDLLAVKERFNQAKSTGNKDAIKTVTDEWDKIAGVRATLKNDLTLMIAEKNEILKAENNAGATQ